MLESPRAAAPTARQLFIGFLAIALRAFGGVLPFARHELVVERRWLGEQEFTDLLGLCQFLPGPNIGNLAIVVGSRFAGARGALAASLGLYLAPIIIAIALGTAYAHYAGLAVVSRALSGVAAAAAGLIAAMAWKMAQPLMQAASPPKWTAWAFLALTFIAVAILRLPLAWVMLTLGPLSVLAARKTLAP